MTHLELLAHVAGETDHPEADVCRALDATFEAITAEVARPAERRESALGGDASASKDEDAGTGSHG